MPTDFDIHTLGIFTDDELAAVELATLKVAEIEAAVRATMVEEDWTSRDIELADIEIRAIDSTPDEDSDDPLAVTIYWQGEIMIDGEVEAIFDVPDHAPDQVTLDYDVED